MTRNDVSAFIATSLFRPPIALLPLPSWATLKPRPLIVSDLIGQFQAFTPKFVKKYCDVATIITDAMKAYCADVREGKFPEDQHCYHMIKGEKEKFLAQMKK